jgi:uncharacterized caspase-like protein
MAAPVEATGTLISFATKHGNTAADGDGKHSPYADGIAVCAEESRRRGNRADAARVQQSVKQTTNGQQEPWRYGSLDGDFYFKPPDPADSSRVSAGPSNAPYEEATRRAKRTGGARKGRAAEVDQGPPGSQRTRHCRGREGAEAGQVKARSPRRSSAAMNRRRANAKQCRSQWRKCFKDALDKQKAALPEPYGRARAQQRADRPASRR